MDALCPGLDIGFEMQKSTSSKASLRRKEESRDGMESSYTDTVKWGMTPLSQNKQLFR